MKLFTTNGKKIEELLYKKNSEYFRGYVNIEYEGELCTEETHGLKICMKNSILEKFVHLGWDEKEKKYFLKILPLSRYNPVIESTDTISWTDYKDNCYHGPKSKVYLQITKGKHKDKICVCDLKIQVPTFKKPSGDKRKGDLEGDVVGQKEFCFFGEHPSSDFLYGYTVKQKDLGGKCVYIFNLNNKKIKSIAHKSSTTKPAQETYLRKMIFKVQEKLLDCIKDYNDNINNIKFIDDNAESRCGEGLDFHLHNCFKYLIEDYIDKFFSV